MVLEIFQNEYVYAAAILVSTVIVSELVIQVFRRHFLRLSKKTKTNLDDLILSALMKPLRIFVLFAGAYLAVRGLSIAAPYLALIENAYFLAAVLIASVAASRILSVVILHGLKVHQRFEKTPQLLNRIIKTSVYLIALLVVLNHFGVEITPMIAALGIGGLAIGLALQPTLSNLFAGLHIISDKPVNVGDFVEIEDGKVSGFVEDIGWRSTRIKTLPNNIVIIPNSKLAESTIMNDSIPEREMAVVIQCGVAYGSDLKKVENVTIDAARRIQKTVEGAVADHEPFIRYHTFGDSNINFSIILRVKTFVDKFLVTHEFIKELDEAYRKAGIEISWPVRKIFSASI